MTQLVPDGSTGPQDQPTCVPGRSLICSAYEGVGGGPISRTAAEIGAAIAAAVINAIRVLLDKAGREAAQGGALPIPGSPKAPGTKETA